MKLYNIYFIYCLGRQALIIVLITDNDRFDNQ